MPTFSVTLTQAQVDRLKAASPNASAVDWQNWLKRQLKAEILRRERLKTETAQASALSTATVQLEQELTAEEWG